MVVLGPTAPYLDELLGKGPLIEPNVYGNPSGKMSEFCDAMYTSLVRVRGLISQITGPLSKLNELDLINLLLISMYNIVYRKRKYI